MNLAVISYLNESELICLLTSIAIVSTIKWFQLLLTLIIQFNINHLFAQSFVVTNIAI